MYVTYLHVCVHRRIVTVLYFLVSTFFFLFRTYNTTIFLFSIWPRLSLNLWRQKDSLKCICRNVVCDLSPTKMSNFLCLIKLKHTFHSCFFWSAKEKYFKMVIQCRMYLHSKCCNVRYFTLVIYYLENKFLCRSLPSFATASYIA